MIDQIFAVVTEIAEEDSLSTLLEQKKRIKLGEDCLEIPLQLLPGNAISVIAWKRHFSHCLEMPFQSLPGNAISVLEPKILKLSIPKTEMYLLIRRKRRYELPATAGGWCKSHRHPC